jgi:hypothetical protein
VRLVFGRTVSIRTLAGFAGQPVESMLSLRGLHLPGPQLAGRRGRASGRFVLVLLCVSVVDPAAFELARQQIDFTINIDKL